MQSSLSSKIVGIERVDRKRGLERLGAMNCQRARLLIGSCDDYLKMKIWWLMDWWKMLREDLKLDSSMEELLKEGLEFARANMTV